MSADDKAKQSLVDKALSPLSSLASTPERQLSTDSDHFPPLPPSESPSASSSSSSRETSTGSAFQTPSRRIRPDNWWQKHRQPSSDSKPEPATRSQTTRSASFKLWHRRDSLAQLESAPGTAPLITDLDQVPPWLRTPQYLSRRLTKSRTPSQTYASSSSRPPSQTYASSSSRPPSRPPSRTYASSSSPTPARMDRLRPHSIAMTAHHREAVRLAEEQQRAVTEKCKRSNQLAPNYAFDELIGKGSFGRVYKGRQISTQKVVAIKVLDVDDADFRAFGDQKDEQIRDFQREIRILRQAQESGAENLNHLIEALPVHSQLWMICEHCPGGSVKTLMRATKDRLQEEKYLVVVARELAKALKGLHEAGIIHRDVKAANVLIHEEGRLQLCDFGVANILETGTDKRRTFIGTLHWMAPEAWLENPEYSDEVDVWGYGCTLYECAVGRPPNSDLREHQKLKVRMRRLKESIALPQDQDFSDELRSLVSSTLTPDVASRPGMVKVLQHDFLKDTEETYPTSILSELVLTYYKWANLGGQRVSLFMPGGAAAASTEDLDADPESADEWNFSMTEGFERRASAILEIPDFSDLSMNEAMEGEDTPRGLAKASAGLPLHEMTAVQKANFEARVQRGADLSNLFDPNKPAYEYQTKTDFIPIPEQRRISDLPFRAMAEDRPSSIASNVIDLGDFDESDYAVVTAPKTDDTIQTTYAGTPMREETIRLADASTLRQKRANSKGPREPINQSLTARRTSSAEAEELPSTTSTHDFAITQEEWTVKGKNRAPELQEPAEITSSRPGHATMDWSFASAMSEASIPQINEPENSEGDSHNTPDAADMEQRARKHATMEWSFSSAMAEANASPSNGEIIDSSPPTQPTPGPSRPTPTRAPLVRQMTMPVTIGDFAQAEEQEIPRPSTALSEAYSDVSASSTDIDPFGLEREEDDHPGPETVDEDVEMGRHYYGRGRSMYSDRGDSTPLTANGPSRYTLVPPAERGVRVSGGSTSTATGTAERPVVDVPPASPPSAAVMSSGASPERVARELIRMLEGMQGSLNAAREVVGGLEWRARQGGVVESEWEDEE
ncbi:hypothetical protein LTR99_002004 [Exophiala xenobiotica]|nr:hypothetical protein LTR96_002243 [Exophiala xenobiotica]KAK5306313.1 hypothetical protein LTR99_002004 [Exophiala xenobiotica]